MSIKSFENQLKHVKRFSAILPLVWPTTMRLQLHFPFIGLCLVASRAVNVLTPITLGQLVDELADFQTGGTISWKTVGVYSMLRYLDCPAGLNLYRHLLWLPLKKNMHIQLSSAAYAQVMNQSSEFHDSKRSGKVWERIRHGISIIKLFELVVFEALPMMTDLILAVSVFWWMFDFYMVLVVLNVIVVFFWTMQKTQLLKTIRQKDLNRYREGEVQHLTDSTLNWQTVSYFGRIQYEVGKYTNALTKSQNAIVAYQHASLLGSVCRSLILLLGLLIGCIYVTSQVRHGTRKAGDFMVLLNFWQQMTGPLQWFARGFGLVSHDLLNAENYLLLLERTPAVRDQPEAKDFVSGKGFVEFKNVSFAYDGKRSVISDLNLVVRPGQTVAFVGKSGGGKSTILKLLFRLYDVDSGQILVDGQDIRHVKLESLRSQMGVVPQQTILFNDTVLNNLLYGRLDAKFEEVVAACEAVELHKRILSFRDGYEEIVGERGAKISGGEAQRMAIARVMLMNPKILLLDEATSSVDSETEMLVQSGLKSLSEGRTTFVVAHRLSTIVHADIIVVIDDGKIIEKGTHADLLNLRGLYHEQWITQRREIP